MDRLTANWQRKTFTSHLLLPLSWLYCLIVLVRKTLYRLGVLSTVKLPVPVIVVGNLTVGGTGKTPLVIWLSRWLREQGFRPGVVSRGYGGRARRWPQPVRADADPDIVGDEPVLLARHCGCPVMVDPRRPRAAQALLDNEHCDVIVSDDGLQHYALARDIEIAVIDGERRFGNGRCLPAGPLREPLSRLRSVDLCVVNGSSRGQELDMIMSPVGFINLKHKHRCEPAGFFRGGTVHAVAGIGHPQRFFAGLGELGLEVIAHPFPDHHRYRPQDIGFHDDLPVIMTEKDAVKCEAMIDFSASRGDRWWYLAIAAIPNAELGQRLSRLLEDRIRG